VVPRPLEAVASPPAGEACHSLPVDQDTKAPPASHRCRRIPWHVLMRRGLGIDVETCPRCRGDSPRRSVAGGPGKMKVIALVQDPASIARHFRRLGLPACEPSMAPARAPPYWPPPAPPVRPAPRRKPGVGHLEAVNPACHTARTRRAARVSSALRRKIAPRRPVSRRVSAPPTLHQTPFRPSCTRPLPCPTHPEGVCMLTAQHGSCRLFAREMSEWQRKDAVWTGRYIGEGKARTLVRVPAVLSC
jgi:hypothetical protein